MKSLSNPQSEKGPELGSKLQNRLLTKLGLTGSLYRRQHPQEQDVPRG